VSQEALAEEMEVTRQTIISLEKGKYTASLNLAYKLAKYFETTIEDIFFSENEEEDVL
jgi:putative transcriptional regulator